MKITLEERKLGCLLGLAIGDAMGVSLEFMSREEIVEKHGSEEIREMIGGGWSQALVGGVTDDTEMMICLASSLIENNGYKKEDVLEEYLNWAGRGSPYVGRIVRGVLMKINEGAGMEEASRIYHEETSGQSAGNGAIMRIAPLALFYRNDSSSLERFAKEDTLLTHYHPLAIEASLAYVRKLTFLLNQTQGQIDLSDLSSEVQEACNLTPREAAKRMQTEGGYVLATLAASYASLHFSSFEEGIVWAINQGGDADTNAACAGALLGAREGIKAIPKRWLEKLIIREQIIPLAAIL